MLRRGALAVMALTGWVWHHAAEEDLSGFLTMTGQIIQFTDPAAKRYKWSEPEFMALKQTEITTSTGWTPKATFRGPLLADVLRHVGADGVRMVVRSLGDHNLPIPCQTVPQQRRPGEQSRRRAHDPPRVRPDRGRGSTQRDTVRTRHAPDPGQVHSASLADQR